MTRLLVVGFNQHALSGVVILPQALHNKMDKDAIVELLDEFTSGIVGEEADGSFRIAFARSCEMVGELTKQLHAKNLDLCFPASKNGTETLYMNIVPANDFSKSIPHDLLSNFVWLPNKMGMYTFTKSEMQGMSLHQLFLQLEPNFTPCLLEDEPGTDNFYLHVANKDDVRVPKCDELVSSSNRDLLPMIGMSVFVFFLAFYTEGNFQSLLALFTKNEE